MFRMPSVCDSCVFNRQDQSEICDAFPEGIPILITAGGSSHFDPAEEGGITWQLREGLEFKLSDYIGFWFDIEQELN